MLCVGQNVTSTQVPVTVLSVHCSPAVHESRYRGQHHQEGGQGPGWRFCGSQVQIYLSIKFICISIYLTLLQLYRLNLVCRGQFSRFYSPSKCYNSIILPYVTLFVSCFLCHAFVSFFLCHAFVSCLLSLFFSLSLSPKVFPLMANLWTF